MRVAYGIGMSEWCGNCHGAIHTARQPHRPSAFLHAVGSARRSSGCSANIYNAYVDDRQTSAEAR